MRKFDNKNRQQFNRGPKRDFKKGGYKGKGRRDEKRGPPPFDVLLRRWKKYVEVNGVIAEVKKREAFVKPSELRQRKINTAKRRVQKQKRLEQAEWERRRQSRNYW
jgi:small subunit ribosomal protein S21